MRLQCVALLSTLLVATGGNAGSRRPEKAAGVAADDRTERGAAAAARLLVRSESVGVLSTLLTRRTDDLADGPYPFAAMDYYADGCLSGSAGGNETVAAATPVFLMSTLQQNVVDLRDNDRAALTVRKTPVGSLSATRGFQTPFLTAASTPMQLARVTLVGKLSPLVLKSGGHRDYVRQCFLARHPDAAAWVDWGDFEFYGLDIRAIYYVGGFGNLHYIGWIDRDLYLRGL